MKMNKEIFNKLVEETNCSCLCGVNTHILERFAKAVCEWQEDEILFKLHALKVPNPEYGMLDKIDRTYNNALIEAINTIEQ